MSVESVVTFVVPVFDSKKLEEIAAEFVWPEGRSEQLKPFLKDRPGWHVKCFGKNDSFGFHGIFNYFHETDAVDVLTLWMAAMQGPAGKHAIWRYANGILSCQCEHDNTMTIHEIGWKTYSAAEIPLRPIAYGKDDS